MDTANQALSEGRAEFALDLYKELMALHPDDPRPPFNLGVALSHMGEKQLAREAYVVSISRESALTLTLTLFGGLYRIHIERECRQVSCRGVE